jgi:hypothetical protein
MSRVTDGERCAASSAVEEAGLQVSARPQVRYVLPKTFLKTGMAFSMSSIRPSEMRA